MQEKLLKSINKKLEVIVVLLLQLRLLKPETHTLRDQIEALSDTGLKPKEIADILGRSNIYINKELSKIREKNRKKNENKVKK